MALAVMLSCFYENNDHARFRHRSAFATRDGPQSHELQASGQRRDSPRALRRPFGRTRWCEGAALRVGVPARRRPATAAATGTGRRSRTRCRRSPRKSAFMIIPDANLIIYAHNRSDPDHAAALAWRKALLAGAGPCRLTAGLPAVCRRGRFAHNRRPYRCAGDRVSGRGSYLRPRFWPVPWSALEDPSLRLTGTGRRSTLGIEAAIARRMQAIRPENVGCVWRIRRL